MGSQCVEQDCAPERDARKDHLFLLRLPFGTAYVDGAEMDRVTNAGVSLRHGPKGDLYHVGCIGILQREERLSAFLAKQPRWVGP